MDENLKKVYAQLKQYRTREDLTLKPTDLLKETFVGFDGEERPIKLRYYQVQGVLHMVCMNAFVLGDDCGLGKTLQTIAAYCYVCGRPNEKDTKAIIMTNKSVTEQWALEFEKFTKPGAINVIVCKGTPKRREKFYEQFVASEGPTVMVMGYATARQDITRLLEFKDYILVLDEATAVKNPKSRIHKCIAHMAKNARRVWGLTATLIKNNLIEGYGIYQVVNPGLFPKSTNKFMEQFAVTRLQRLPKSNRSVPVIVGYRKDHISRFRQLIDPFFLSRSKMDVATELPVVTFQEEYVDMLPAQKVKYQEALDGLLEIDATGEEKETTQLTSLIYCQQIVDHPALIECDGDSNKMKRLFEKLTEGDLGDEKIIVFSRFRGMVDILEEEAKKKKIPCTRITGSENEEERRDAMLKFQDPKDDTRVCFITMAAAEGINLQAAKAFFFYDLPWSAGDLIQLLGRMLRIGSKHDRCYAVYFLTRDSIDEHVLKILKKKMKLLESIMGKRLKGEKEDKETMVKMENEISDLFDSLQEEARRRKKYKK